jgi:hypothetical protein
MLDELSRHENLGTPKYFHELFTRLANGDRSWTVFNVNEYFYNRIVDGIAVFDGCVPLAKAVGAVVVDDKGCINLDPSISRALSSETHLSNKFLEMIFKALKHDESFHQIFSATNISYDVIYRYIQIENAAFRLRYANFRHLLVSFNFLQPHPDSDIRKLIINQRYRRLFDRELMPEIKKRKVGIEQLRQLLTQKQIYGQEGEEFALKYERKRLTTHKHSEAIEIISEYDAGAGYDIVSFENVDSTSHDRFIEVKSFSGLPRFHWSRNEMDVARIKKNQYYLYLVDRAQMTKEGYLPLIIQNPHEKIFDNPAQWEKSIDAYLITQLAAGNTVDSDTIDS